MSIDLSGSLAPAILEAIEGGVGVQGDEAIVKNPREIFSLIRLNINRSKKTLEEEWIALYITRLRTLS